MPSTSPSLGLVRRVFALLTAVSSRLAGAVAWQLLMYPVPGRRRPTQAQRWLLAAGDPRRLTAASGEARIYTWPGASARTVLLVHGWRGSALSLRYFIAPLVRAGFNVVAIDGPAHGLAPGRRTHLVAFTQAIDRALADCAARGRPVAAAVGHSLGAMALAYALSGQCPGCARPPHRLERCVLLSAPDRVGDLLDWFEASLALAPPVTDRVRAEIEARTGVPLDDSAVSRWLKTLVCPVFALHDRSDREVPPATLHRLRAARGERADDRWVMTRGLGHTGVLRDREVIERVTRFLADGPPPTPAAQGRGVDPLEAGHGPPGRRALT